MIGPASARQATSVLPQQVPLPAAVGVPRTTDDIERGTKRRASASTNAASTRLLWIEDQPALMGGLVACLAKEGFEVDFATTGALGLRMASSAAYEIILLDLRLPDVQGMDLLKSIQAAGVSTPVVVLTGYSSPESAFEAALSGAAGFKSKPLKPVDLLETVRSVINASKRKPRAQLFRESRGHGPSPSVRRIVRLLSQIAILTEAPGSNAWLEIRSVLRTELLRSAADPNVTLREFSAMGEALRMIAGDERPWPRLALQRVLDLFDAASGCDWTQIDETVRRLVAMLTGSGKASLRMDEHAIVQELGVDNADLSSGLRGELGLSIAQLRRVIFMRRAVQMLAVSDEQVAQIAYAIGFEHPSAFDHAFTNFFGVSPRTFRKLMFARSGEGA